MKTIMIFMCLCVAIVNANAQKIIEKHISVSGKKDLVLNIQIADSIIVHTWNKPEIYAIASVNINENENNDAYETSFDESDNQVKIKAKFADGYMQERKHCCDETMISWELYIPEKTDFSVESINANIIIDGVTTNVHAKSISGFIDLVMAAGRNADLEMKTISGTLYTDLNINTGKSNNSFPSVVKQKINNGGDEVDLETISGDIYVRKTK